MASLDNLRGLWKMAAVPSCLVSGPGVIEAGELRPWLWEPDREVVRGMVS